MATPTSAPSPFPSEKKRTLRTLLLVIGGLLVLGVISGAAWIYQTERRELPQVDGSLSVRGLSAPVIVVRDKQGVPHIRAASYDDLFFAQGFVTAQDRLWQMDMLRRYASGNLAELLGEQFLPHDRRQRYLQIQEACERGAQALDPQTRRWLEDYVRGVNAFIDRTHDRLPLEFKLLHYRPAPWRVEDSLLIGANMSQMLNTQYDLELKRKKVIRHLTPEEIADLYPATSWRDLPPAQQANFGAEQEDKQHSDDNAPATTKTTAVVQDQTGNLSVSVAAAQKSCPMCVPGSNNWVVSGEHTYSGKPLLSNDMHLDHTLPDVWYEAQLTEGDGQQYDVGGVTLPGLPFVIVGHNRRIAWGFTNLGPDVQDLFVEHFNAAGQVATPSGFEQPKRVHEVIHVKDHPDHSLDVLITRHGPIITPIIPGETRQLALEWTLYDPTTIGNPFFDVNSAHNWQEFRAAFSKFGGPSQNVVYADVDGHIGYQATGKIPIRASGDGLEPQDGSNAAHDWTGYIPFDQLPSVYDPPSGILATANGRITPDGYPHLLANVWWSPYRTARIFQLLTEDEDVKFKPADMLKIQLDITSELERFFADRFVYAIDRHQGKLTGKVRQAAEIMRGWNGRMDKNSPAAAIEYFSRQNLMRMLLDPKLGTDYKNYDWGLSLSALENIITHRPPRWLPPGFKSYDDVLISAVAKAVQASGGPSKLASWRWGEHFPVKLQNPVLGSVPILGWFSGTREYWQSGSGTTVKQIGNNFGPSERMTVDLANLDSSTLNIVVGESGHLLSSHYKDQFPAWYNGTTYQFPFSENAVNAAAEHRLSLVPEQ